MKLAILITLLLTSSTVNSMPAESTEEVPASTSEVAMDTSEVKDSMFDNTVEPLIKDPPRKEQPLIKDTS